MTTIPVCSSGLSAAGTTTADYLDAFYTFWAANAGSFTLENVVGAPVTSFTATHLDGWQINYRLDSGTILSLIAPEGGIADSAAPGTPTNASVEDVILPVTAGTSAQMSIAIYTDAVFCGIKDAGTTHYEYGWHQGKIHVPGDLSDPARGNDGLGVLAYLIDGAQSATAFKWLCTSGVAGNRKSKVRTGTSTWDSPGITRSLETGWAAAAEKRMASEGITATDGVQPSTSSPTRGLYTYLRADTSGTLAPVSVVPSLTTDQGWLAIRDSSSATRVRILWNKTATP